MLAVNAEKRTAWRASMRAAAAAAGVIRHPASVRAEELFSQLGEEVLSLRIAIAQARDGTLNEAELIAMLDVYEEFGR